MSGRRRDRCECVIDLLRAARTWSRKTAIFRKANTNHTRGSEYLEACVEAALVAEREDRYMLTDRGREILDHWAVVAEALPVLDEVELPRAVSP